MSDTPGHQPEARRKTFVNLASGPKGSGWLPPLFVSWRELRVDINPDVAPDILADMTDLSAIETGSVEAVYVSHGLEHLFLHQVDAAITEAYRILAEDGFLCLIVPDLQSLAELVVNDRLHEVVYQSEAGPVTAHDVLYGYSGYMERGVVGMAHHCGFTPTLLVQKLQLAPFAEIVMRRRPHHELAAVASKRPAPSDAAREAFLTALQL